MADVNGIHPIPSLSWESAVFGKKCVNAKVECNIPAINHNPIKKDKELNKVKVIWAVNAILFGSIAIIFKIKMFE